MDFFDFMILGFFFHSYHQHVPPQQHVHYYDYALTKCHYNDTVWTIHGLWPQYNRTSWPMNCKDNWNGTAITSLLPELNKYWPSCYGQKYEDPVGFWKHEWKKHGSCTNMTEFDYFNTTLMLYKMNYDGFFQYVCSGKNSNCKIPLKISDLKI